MKEPLRRLLFSMLRNVSSVQFRQEQQREIPAFFDMDRLRARTEDFMQPYSDENMIFDEATRHFVLTEKALIAHGTDIRTRVSRNKTVDATGVITRLCTRVSEMIYTYLHTFTMDNAAQDEIIATVPACRQVIFSALLNQMEYLLMNGDFSRSAEPEKRKYAIDDTAKSLLDTVIPCLGVSITYAGAGGYGHP